MEISQTKSLRMGPVDHHKPAGLVFEINRIRDVVHKQFQQMPGPAILLPDQVALDGIGDGLGQQLSSAQTGGGNRCVQ